jgi:hypothetical protein
MMTIVAKRINFFRTFGMQIFEIFDEINMKILKKCIQFLFSLLMDVGLKNYRKQIDVHI